MPQIERIRIQNYRTLKDVILGKNFEFQQPEALPKMVAIIGANGSGKSSLMFGKSSLMDAFGFIRGCLIEGVEAACDKPHRGGFDRLRTRGQAGPIVFEIFYRQSRVARPISYTLAIDANASGQPFVAQESLRQRRKGQSSGRPYKFLDINSGRGVVWAGEAVGGRESKERLEIQLQDTQVLAITTLGNLAEHPRIVEFWNFLEGWYLSYCIPDAARELPASGAQKHLNRTGSNLANYTQYLERQHEARFEDVLKRITKKIPGVTKIHAERQKDNRLLLQFNDRGYIDPFYAQDMSDGTLKMFAYLLLLEDPDPAPLIGIEEPENGLHPQLLTALATEMRKYAWLEQGPQIVVTTHSPYFVDALTPKEVWQLDKGPDGHSKLTRTADIPLVSEMADEGVPLGSLWYSEHFGRLFQ